tara:strand:- start:146 stop:388 length:243 start_codon:yes stop_codon:yes gene_type:complete
MNVDFGVVELVMMIVMGLLGYLWRTQATDVRQTTVDLNKLSIKFAEARGASEATNKTLFAHIEEIKNAVERMENLLLNKK